MFLGNNTKLRPANDLQLAPMLIMAALAVSVLSLAELEARDPQKLAQAAPAPQASRTLETPAESKPGGTRPTTPAPEPARPDPQARKEGAKAALPPAPAERIAQPIKEKDK